MSISMIAAASFLLASSVPQAVVECGEPVGADLVVSELTSVGHFGALDGVAGFSVGTTVCNLGTASARWEATTTHHPVVVQNLYRLTTRPDGVSRFEQIGLSWAMHAIFPLNSNLCCSCSVGGGTALGAGCSDTSNSTINGYQPRLGPRLEINASGGSFPFPNTFDGATGNSIYKRLQVPVAALDPAQNVGARYFLEAHFLSEDDATAGNHHNNAAYREAVVSGAAPNRHLAVIGATTPQRAAIGAWKDAVPSVVETDVIVSEPGEPAGRLIVSANVTDLGDGTWNYEYAVYNMNSDRGVGRFAVPVDSAAAVTEVGFHDVSFHSGDGVGSSDVDPFDMDGTDWPHEHADGALIWATVEPFAQDPNGNAIRWGTLYNFRFTVDSPPRPGAVTLGLFTPGTLDGVTAGTLVPSPLFGTTDGDFDGDGDVDLADFALFGQCFGGANLPPAGACPPGVDADLDDDGDVDLSDFAAFAQNFTGAG
jgi:hypothetical protein